MKLISMIILNLVISQVEWSKIIVLSQKEWSITNWKKKEVAVFTHEGSLDNLSETYKYIYEEWLPKSGYELADGDEVEWYDSRFKYDSADSQMDIHIPIKKIEKIENELDIFAEIQTEFEEEK
ncbi:MAG: hypothetical protein DRH89_00625 [Candidatus Cloacimonadota bacterium]|nr:MAG: hypothetical protein DRH89_00625 [Candidatus Cloacimonadota bacterium]